MRAQSADRPLGRAPVPQIRSASSPSPSRASLSLPRETSSSSSRRCAATRGRARRLRSAPALKNTEAAPTPGRPALRGQQHDSDGGRLAVTQLALISRDGCFRAAGGVPRCLPRGSEGARQPRSAAAARARASLSELDHGRRVACGRENSRARRGSRPCRQERRRDHRQRPSSSLGPGWSLSGRPRRLRAELYLRTASYMTSSVTSSSTSVLRKRLSP